MAGKKIIILGPAHPYRGGLATYNERMAREFMANGDEVSMQTFTVQYPNFLFPGKSQYSDSPVPTDIDITRTVNSVSPLNWIKVAKQIRKEKPDILLLRYWLPFMAPCMGTIAKLVKKNNHTRIVTIIDNIIPHEKRPGDTMLSQYFVNNCDGFLVMSKSVEEDLKQFNKRNKPVSYTPHPLSDNFGDVVEKQVAKQNLGLDVGTNFLLFFGFIRDYKGLDLLLKAFAKSNLENTKLIVAGEFYSKEETYQNLIDELGIRDRLVLKTDFIPDAEVANYFGACDMVVQPYKTATQSGVTQIAYHFNKPMLVTNVGGLAELIPDEKVGYVVEPNIEAIKNALQDFYVNKREQQFTEGVSEEKRKFSWQKLTESIYSL